MSEIAILLADDHTIVRESLARLIDDESDMEVVAQAASVSELLDTAGSVDHDVLVLDISMGNLTSLDAMKNLLARRPDRPILVLSMHPEQIYAVRYLKAGAAGYLSKDSSPEELIDAIRKVHSGQRHISERLTGLLLSGELHETSDLPHMALSDREYEVFAALSLGRRIRQIAEDLNLSEKTVSTYRTRILEKMGFESNEEIVRYARTHNLHQAEQ